MNRHFLIAIATLLPLGSTAVAFADGAQAKPAAPAAKPATAAPTEARLTVRPVAKLIGMELQNAKGEKLARLEDAIVVASGELSYAVVARENDAKLHLVPWALVHLRAESDDARPATLRVEVDAARLAASPGFDAARWPTSTEDALFAEVERYYAADQRAAKPIAIGAKPSGAFMTRATKLTGHAVESAGGEKLGELRTVVVDPEHGRVAYAALALAGANGAVERTLALPWDALVATRDGDREKLGLDVAKEKLTSALEFRDDEASWKEMSDPVWIGKVYAHFGARPYWTGAPAPKGPNGEKP